MSDSLKIFNERLICCRLCPRLVLHRETVPLPAAFKGQEAWRKPVPGFGDPNAWLLILGLAPSPQGGNRTGRIFTGDKSAIFLVNALYSEGLASQPTSIDRHDHLKLYGCYMTAAVKCVPPQHKPLSEEFKRCTSTYLFPELQLLPKLKAVLCLGKLAFDSYFAWAKTTIKEIKKPAFKHGQLYSNEGLLKLYASYHPSPQNTNTGVLTEKMFRELLRVIIRDNY